MIDWIGGHEARVLVSLLVIFLTIWGFAAWADNVVAGDTLPFDEWVLRALRRADNPAMPIGPAWLAEAGRDLTALGGMTVMTLLTTAVALYLRLRKMYAAMWLLLIATVGGYFSNLLLKSLFERARPQVVPHLAAVSASSFPSGHSMVSATVFLTLGALLGRFVQGRWLKAYFLIVALVLTVLVGLSRVYMGVHYPTDVLAGWSAGLAWALACWLTARFLQRRGTVEGDEAGVNLSKTEIVRTVPGP